MRVSLQREPVMEAAVKYDVDGEPFFFIRLGGCQCNPERIRIRLYLGSHAGARARPVCEMRIAGRGDQFGGHSPGLETEIGRAPCRGRGASREGARYRQMRVEQTRR